jgi:hypothetical protein
MTKPPQSVYVSGRGMRSFIGVGTGRLAGFAWLCTAVTGFFARLTWPEWFLSSVLGIVAVVTFVVGLWLYAGEAPTSKSDVPKESLTGDSD